MTISNLSAANLARINVDPLPSNLRTIAQYLLEHHWQTVDRDRLLAVYFELSACMIRSKAGAIVEYGCYRGAMSAWIRAVLDFVGSDRIIHVFDSFQGLPQPDEIDGTHLAKGDVRADIEELKELHSTLGLATPVIHAGWFADTVKEIPDQVSFAYVDADFYTSTMTALRTVLPRLQAGGVVILDDYCDRERNPRAWNELPGVKQAWDDAADDPQKIDVLIGAGDLAFGVYRAPFPVGCV